MTTPEYTARIIEPDGVSCYLDIQPPIGLISNDYLRDFGADERVTVDHKITTAHTTRLSMTIEDENRMDEDRVAAFENTAKYILSVLIGTDKGLDIGGYESARTIELHSGKS